MTRTRKENFNVFEQHYSKRETETAYRTPRSAARVYLTARPLTR